MKRGLLLAWCALAVALSCAAPNSAKVSTYESRPEQRHPVVMPGDDYRGEIERLDREITEAREQSHVPAPEPMAMCPDCLPPTMVGAVPYKNDPACRPAKNDACDSSCTLSDSICNNADKICDIYDRYLAGDKWAENKCATANQTCKQARERCCGCQ